MIRPKCQLYIVSPPQVGGDFPARLEEALSAGPVAAFQFRVKDVDQHKAVELALPLQEICARHDVAFIVNDSIALAKRIKADGVHLGQSDGDPRDARAELGKEAQIGVTCHNSRHLAMEAADGGADYVAFGAFFPTSTKKVDHIADLATLELWSQFTEVPCVAIGGITLDNAKPVIAAGADFIAISGAIWNHADGPAAAVEAFNALLA
jgi:thiamine-phosphate pyrophosphorylase